ncbi:hypothetical protein BJ138DRAFT_1158960 [Hygrophoropsis aurantiaca]|uniref:Uncharacterized protein n=1 Tax=Hygrophoropsis aurantiaca TaxID=72124 RepID=A0ACB8A3E0_9AGAM|nr:hypothetical protein BJ138DRAFT_1158960 [Hygrophoropsis aurantiaca]
MSTLAEISYPLATLPSIADNLDDIDSRKALPYLMAFMKNTFIRALNNVYQAAPLIPKDPAIIRAFLDYIKCICALLQTHLDGDHLFFTSTSCGVPLVKAIGPACNPDTLPIKDSLAQLTRVIVSWNENPRAYSPDVLRSAVGFGLRLARDMKAQLASLTFDRLSSAVSDKNLRDMIRDNVEWFAAKSDITFLLPFVISHHDSSTSRHWPPIHDQGLQALPNLVQEHAGCWRFAPVDPLTRERSHSWVC